ncbi:RINGLET 1, homeobox-1 [Hibiscus trionum]|uniref:RINGLET 1, homeobox-1 n=1 Tax=Hibiscus trionum TaxID=183268 RepID=A0A9W7H8I6_HIBTR|nr:RINGLET 1, homeobox-1 [Hibiscus trionum]
MASGSEDENNERKVSNKKAISSNEGNAKPKRQMKTPFQLETLEDAFALETYPSEATRAELSEKLGLTDRQLQTWFCHRRLKEKKETPSKNPKKGATLPPDSPIDDFRVGSESDDGSESGSGSGSSPCMNFRKLGGSSSTGMMELRAIACVQAQLGQPLRDDGPMLGMEFDPLPPDAFEDIPELHKRSGQPYESKLYDRCASKAAARAIHEYQFLPDHSSLRYDAGRQVAHSLFYESPVDGARGGAALFLRGEEPLCRVPGIQGQGSRVPLLPQQYNTGILSLSDDPRNNRKRKSDENRIAREVEVQDNGIHKELEKLDNKRRKSEERMRKEMERHERERRKGEERLMREKQREEERLQREKQREEERRQKILQKEYFRAEKKRQKEELQREKEEERRRVAREKATSRKIAKESMGLLEDEQLELMEYAAASKGIPSIIQLDHNDLKNLESFRDSLNLFPPKSVQLKRPFAIHPWTDSEENVGNLLMAWKFFITFSDVLKLWPFTLDEFVQAFHDYGSRLLGEIHVALLKTIIKDIEDVARTTVTGLGMNQYSASHLEGGHPQIVEGAYSWGFDIRSWQHHLNPLTWPEIFRQLAISAGFGPQLKKQSATWSYMGDNDQDLQSKGCEDVVSTLRNGAAAENAFALMRKKGLLLRRRSRHRLTPGTVKFAAFHVLSLEGSKGLTVFELADKIQKSGLRDVTTSKRPEACISVAMTRDAKLFERIAPSTYCVRPAYRKDPADAEVILEAARQKIQQFENGLLGGEDADEVEKEEVERDEDSEGDVDEDPEVDIATPSNANKDADYHKDEVNICSGSEKVHASTDGAVNVPCKFDKDLLSFPSNTVKDDNAPCNTGHYLIGEENGTGNLDQQNIEIDESKFGESWIQGLSEAEYSHLSVEERLNALVALIGIANEGNTIRTAIEDRLEAANALKKQMWIEAQLDKSLVKEETIIKMDFPSVIGMKAEAHLPNYPMEGSQSKFPAAANKNDELSPSNPEDQKTLLCSQNFLNGLNSFPAERTVLQEASMGPDDFSAQQHGYGLKRSRSQLKSYISHRAEEIYAYRSLPLGLDRRCNRYWQFVASASKNDPCAGRIFVELHGGVWRMIDSEEAFEALLSSLDARGIRESHLRIMLQKIETSFKENVRRNLQCVAAINRSGSSTENETSEIDYSPDFPASFDNASGAICGLNSDASAALSSFKSQLGTNENEIKSALNRYQDFQMWMWKESYNCSTLCAMKYGKKRSVQLLVVCDVCLGSHVPEEKHCFHCHQTFGSINRSFNFSEHKCNENKKLDTKDTRTLDSSIPSGISLLKSLCALVEVSIPPEALESIWTEDHRKIWGTKLNASSSVDEILKILTHLENAIKQDHLLPIFKTTREFLGSNLQSESDFTDSVLPWIPQTTAAVALRLLVLDASIMYLKQEKGEPAENRETRTYIKLSSRTSLFIKNKGLGSEKLDQMEPMRRENFADLSNSKRNKYKQGRGGRESGRKSQRRASNSNHRASKKSSREKNNLSVHLKQHGRTVRKRTERRGADNTMVASKTDVVKPKASAVTPRDSDEEWRGEKFRMMQGENPTDSNSMEEESDDNAQGEGYEQGNWEPDCNGWNGESVEASDEDDSGFKLQKEKEDLDEDGDLEMSDASEEVANETRNDDGFKGELTRAARPLPHRSKQIWNAIEAKGLAHFEWMICEKFLENAKFISLMQYGKKNHVHKLIE